MKKIIVFVSCVLCLGFANGQVPSFEWAKSMGGVDNNNGHSVAVDLLGNVLTTGMFEGSIDSNPGAGVLNLTSNGGLDVFISKFDNSGNFLWAKNIGGTLSDIAYSITTDVLGNVYITGVFDGTVDFDPGIGIFNLISAGNGDSFVLKLNALGNFMWVKEIAGVDYENGYSIIVDENENVYTTGYFYGTSDFDPGSGTYNLVSAGSYDIFVFKLDALGNFLWAKQIEGTGYDYGYSIAIDVNGNVYTTGFFGGTADFDPGTGIYNLSSFGNADIFVSKLDSLGNFVWAKQIGGSGYDFGNCISVDKYGNSHIIGTFSDTVDFDPNGGVFNLIPTGSGDTFILKLDVYGNLIWVKQLKGSSTCAGNSVATDSSGNIYAGGVFYDTIDCDPSTGIFNLLSVGSYDMFILKLDALGNYLWAKQIGEFDGDYLSALSVDLQENLYLTGSFLSTVDFDPDAGVFNLNSLGSSDIFVLKLSQQPTGINETINSNNISIYPNPNNGTFNIFFPSQINNGSIEVYNSIGALVYQQEIINQENSIALSNQANGLYFVKVMSENKIVGIGKIMKQ